MLILAVMITLSLTMYIFYKVRYVRTSLPLEKKWLAAKCTISLGSFVAIFGLNQFFIHQTVVGITIGIVFLLLGSYNIYAGIGSYRYYTPLAMKEAKSIK